MRIGWLKLPTPSWTDRGVVVVLLGLTVVEAATRPTLVLRPLAVVLAAGVVLSILWRRTHAFGVATAAYGAIHSINLTAMVLGVRWKPLYTTASVLLLSYSLARRTSGWRLAVGLAVMTGGSMLTGFKSGLGEAITGTVLLLIPTGIGAFVRNRALARAREIEGAKLTERAQLARELHDTVAHHISAIAVQAQAGQMVAKKRPEAAVEVLAVIEEAAARSLTEMRNMVRSLRAAGAEGPASYAPQPQVVDLLRLGEQVSAQLPVDVRVVGDVHGLPSLVQTTLYRLAQEAVTNARRHARDANRDPRDHRRRRALGPPHGSRRRRAQPRLRPGAGLRVRLGGDGGAG